MTQEKKEQPTAVAKSEKGAVARRRNVSDIMRSPGVVNKINDVLGSEKVAAGFISSVISIANGNKQLRQADPMTVVGAAMVAATLQLPVVPTIGLAYIVPYKGQAQFQIGYKGLIELAERSGQFKNIIDEVVYEGQLVRKNRFTGEYLFDEDGKKSDKVIGYMARFDLINGFSKTIYWTREEVEAHARKFSQAYTSGYSSPWKSDFDAMARKTVLKALFSKYAPKSIQMQNAITFDQASVKANEEALTGAAPIEIDAFDVEYVDNIEEAATTEDQAAAARAKAEEMRAKAAAAQNRQARTTATPGKPKRKEAKEATVEDVAAEDVTAEEIPDGVDPETGEVKEEAGEQQDNE